MGILFAILAAVTWALGDFSIERTSRKVGSVAVLLYISLFGAIAYFPFVWTDIHVIQGPTLGLFVIAALTFLFSSVFDFLALKAGKISVVEPICAFEVAVTAIFARVLIGEHITHYQLALIAILVLGIFLVSVKQFSHLRRIHAEKGAWLALIATIGMGLANFLFAEAARVSTPLLINWFGCIFISIIVVIYLIYRGRLKRDLVEVRPNWKWTLSTVTTDNFSWVFYTYAALYMPISIAVAMSESYIVLAALLGFVFNKETLRSHQVLGMVICISSVILLALSLK